MQAVIILKVPRCREAGEGGWAQQAGQQQVAIPAALVQTAERQPVCARGGCSSGIEHREQPAARSRPPPAQVPQGLVTTNQGDSRGAS